MKKAFSVAAIVLSFFAGGCAIHPLPEDVTGVDTYHIVRQIRCEARETVRKTVTRWLSGLDDPLPRSLALQYENDPESISGFHYNLFKSPALVEVRSVAKLFYDTGIAYTFDLTMAEHNDNSTNISFLKPFTEPKFTLGITGAANWTRTNHRLFTVTDTFSHLLTKLNTEVRGKRYCDGQLVGPNYVYPIAGRIGVDKIVTDFIELTLFASLGSKAGTAAGLGAPPTIADTLTFITEIGGSANPVVMFTPVTHAFQLTNASLTAAPRRMDTHQVSVALAIAPSGITELDPLRSFLFSTERGAAVARRPAMAGRSPAISSLVVGRRVTGGGTPSEMLAVVAIDQLKSRELQIIPPP
jgi:hypothetical protein